MNKERFRESTSGRVAQYGQGEAAYWAFLPNPLPPVLTFDVELLRLASDAAYALGELAAFGRTMANPHLLIGPFIRREAVLSSRIEGTQADIADLYAYEAGQLPLPGLTPDLPAADVQEVLNYVRALEYGQQRLATLPVSLRLMRELHERLMQGVRGAHATPGEFRRSQNWIGGTRPGNAQYVPPPPHQVEPCMAALENFLHDKGFSALIKAALAHVQFETIHPFLDGNGRTGRLMIALILHHEGVLRQPLLYLSLYLKQHRAEYYRLLDTVRHQGDWEAWLDFILEGVEQTAAGAVDTAHRLLALFAEDEKRIRDAARAAGSAMRAFVVLRRRPLATIDIIARESAMTFPTASKAIETLANLGITRELTGRQRNRIFAYDRYLAILNEGVHS
ncbi:MAG: Fic family protein [Planctomycetaceae bacterium]|nr:Fic family protein [Planctomycetaceae bacterium]